MVLWCLKSDEGLLSSLKSSICKIPKPSKITTAKTKQMVANNRKDAGRNSMPLDSLSNPDTGKSPTICAPRNTFLKLVFLCWFSISSFWFPNDWIRLCWWKPLDFRLFPDMSCFLESLFTTTAVCVKSGLLRFTRYKIKVMKATFQKRGHSYAWFCAFPTLSFFITWQ